MNCNCELNQYCERFKRNASQKTLEACRGVDEHGRPIDEDFRRSMLNALERHAGRPRKDPVPATPEQFPCVFRGESLGEVPCQVCGQKNMTTEVFSCDLHGKCTVGSHGVTEDGTNATRKVKVCISCDDINQAG